MNLLETYDKNKKKHLLKEVTGTGATGAFVGGAGDFIDTKFAGPFHPELNDLKNYINCNLRLKKWSRRRVFRVRYL